MGRRAKGAAWALALLAAGGIGGSAMAQPRSDSARIERQSAQARAEATRLRQQARATERDIRALNDRLAELGRRRAVAEAEAEAAEARLHDLQARRRAESAAQARDQAMFETLIIAAALAQHDDSAEARAAGLRAGAMADLAAGRHAERADAIAAAAQLEREIAAQRLRLAEAEAQIDADRTSAAQILAQRRALNASLQADARAAERRAATLARQARNLRELASRATRPAQRSASAAATPARPAVLPASWGAPAQGRIVRAYGARDASGQAAQGVTLRTRAGAQVRAPATGAVSFAGPFRSYGHVLIMNLDGGYALVLTGLDSVTVRAGDRISAGQPIGEMSETATPAPDLYVEVRRDGRLLDPSAWLSRNAQVALAD